MLDDYGARKRLPARPKLANLSSSETRAIEKPMVAGAGFRDSIFHKADHKGHVSFDRIALNLAIQALLPLTIIFKICWACCQDHTPYFEAKTVTFRGTAGCSTERRVTTCASTRPRVVTS